jgi:hypothetical protein
MEETESVKATGKQTLAAIDRCLIGVLGVNGEVLKHVYEMIFEWRTLFVGEMWRAKGGWKRIIDEAQGRSAQCAKMTTGITGQKTCILRTDENSDTQWHHWAGKG